MREARATNRQRPYRSIVLVSIIIGLLALICSRVYYAFCFLPQYHDSSLEAAKRLADFDGWLAYVQSVPGLLLHGLMLVSFLTIAFCLCLDVRRDITRQ